MGPSDDAMNGMIRKEKTNKKSKVSLCGLMFYLLIFCYSIDSKATVVINESIQCTYDPTKNLPNPFGSNAFITITQVGVDTHFRYEQFPRLFSRSPLSGNNKVRAVTVAVDRTIIFYNTTIEVARSLMLSNKEFYYELVGYVDLFGYERYDEVISCG